VIKRWVKALVLPALMVAFSLTSLGAASGKASETNRVISSIDLSRSFGTKSSWRLTAIQGPEKPDKDFGPIPGVIKWCLKRTNDRSCSQSISGMPPAPTCYAEVWQPRYLIETRIIYPRGRSAAPLLLIRTGGSIGGNNNQPIFTQILAYRPATDRFDRIFSLLVGRNNNEEVRFLEAGRMRGDVVVAVPVQRSPWGYWISVNRLEPGYRYREVLRYRSATAYGDNNSLAVIDSEMPNIQQRLSLWRPGRPLPLPEKGCPKPHLVKMELWCS
jgi:hypothetical protein